MISEPLPILEPVALLFVIRRFIRDLRKFVGVPVGWTTSTRYVLQDEDDLATLEPEPPTDPKTAKALVPAIGLIGPQVTPNQTDYNATEVYKPTRFVDPDGLRQDGFERRRPPQIVDVSFDIQLFHNRQRLLHVLSERFRQYFIRNPYLVIPIDREDVDALTIPDRAKFIDDYFTNGPTDSIRDGYIVEQHIPIDRPAIASTTGSNSDNLLVATSEVVLQNVQLPDDEVCDHHRSLQRVDLTLFSNDDPVQVPRSEVVVEEDE